MGERDENARRALHDLSHSLYGISQQDRDAIRAQLDRVDQELAPPPPPKPFACVEALSWRTNDTRAVRHGAMPHEALVRYNTEYWTISIGGYDSNLRVSIGNIAVEARVRGKGELAVWWIPALARSTRRRNELRRVVWSLPFDHEQAETYRLASTSLPGAGFVIFLLRAE